MLVSLLLVVGAIFAAPVRNYTSSTLSYTGFSLQFDCSKRSANRWQYTLGYDKGSQPRPSSFYVDPNLPRSCGQFSTKSYGSGYDRGHLVTSNDMDDTYQKIREAHYMTNIVPQVSSFNQGIWAQTEVIHQCYRDINPVTIYGGVVYTDSSNDYFLDSHGIKTPDYMWKVIVTTDSKGKTKSIAWYIPNQENLGNLDEYITSVNEIEKKLNDGLGPIPVSSSIKANVEPFSWPLPSDCSRV